VESWKAGKNKSGNAVESWKTKVINMYIFYQSNFMIYLYIYIWISKSSRKLDNQSHQYEYILPIQFHDFYLYIYGFQNLQESWTTKVINMNTFYQSNLMIFIYIYGFQILQESLKTKVINMNAFDQSNLMIFMFIWISNS